MTAPLITRFGGLEWDGMSWWGDALCAQTDPDLFFPENRESSAPAKKICAACTVTRQCLQYALDNDLRYGIYGGTDPAQRRKLRRAAA